MGVACGRAVRSYCTTRPDAHREALATRPVSAAIPNAKLYLCLMIRYCWLEEAGIMNRHYIVYISVVSKCRNVDSI